MSIMRAWSHAKGQVFSYVIAFEFSFTWKWMYQVQGWKVAGSSKQATLGDSGVTLQNTVDDIEEHLVSLVAVDIKYNVQPKNSNITEIGLFFWHNHLCNFEL